MRLFFAIIDEPISRIELLLQNGLDLQLKRLYYLPITIRNKLLFLVIDKWIVGFKIGSAVESNRGKLDPETDKWIVKKKELAKFT